MARKRRSQETTVEPGSFLGCLNHFLTPAVWRQVLRGWPRAAVRWQPQPLLLVVLLMTWCAGESQAERFETARAFYVASYQRKRRPGKSVEGFHKALAHLPARALRLVAAAIRARLHQVFAAFWLVDGFVPLGCDGSTLACPRSPELQRRLRADTVQDDRPPTVWVTAFVHLSLGLLWSWRLGGAHASEQRHLIHLLGTLPQLALIVTDAGYKGYELLKAIVKADKFFLIRLSSKAPLYTTQRINTWRFQEGLAYYWPLEVQQEGRPPLEVRVIHLRRKGKGKADVWLMTNVLDSERLSRETASKFYRWRWRNEGLFRSYKRTLGKVKLLGRTVVQVHREAESSLLAVQLLLAHGALALAKDGDAGRRLPSVRQVLVEIRAEIRNVTGMYLGPRQRRTYLDRLRRAQWPRWRRRRTNQVRRTWPSRQDHTPPKTPKFRRMGTDLKELLAKTLGTPTGGVS
jgi:hypothetical protein